MNVVLPLGDFFCEPEDLGDHPGFASVNVRAFLEWLYPKRKISASEVPALLERIADATAATKHRTKGHIWCPISVVTIPTVGDDEIWDDDIELAVANFVAAGLRGHPGFARSRGVGRRAGVFRHARLERALGRSFASPGRNPVF